MALGAEAACGVQALPWRESICHIFVMHSHADSASARVKGRQRSKPSAIVATARLRCQSPPPLFREDHSRDVESRRSWPHVAADRWRRTIGFRISGQQLRCRSKCGLGQIGACRACMDQVRILVHYGLGRAGSADLVGVLRPVASARQRQCTVAMSPVAMAVRIRLRGADWPFLAHALPSARPQSQRGAVTSVLRQ